MGEIGTDFLFKYSAKPHWDKNRNLAFLNVQNKYPKFNLFIEAKKQMDPHNVFSGDWSDEILYGKELVKFDGCALEGQCICSEFRHCGPKKWCYSSHGLVYLFIVASGNLFLFSIIIRSRGKAWGSSALVSKQPHM